MIWRLHSFTSPQNRYIWETLCQTCCTPGERGPYNRRLERSQNLSGLTGEEENLLSQMKIKQWFVIISPVSCHCTDYVILAPKSLLGEIYMKFSLVKSRNYKWPQWTTIIFLSYKFWCEPSHHQTQSQSTQQFQEQNM